MATTTYQFSGAGEPDVVKLFAKATIGATGAITVVEAKGITSIAYVSAGLYTVTLVDPYTEILGVDATFLFAGTNGPASPIVKVKSQTITTTKTIVLQFSAAAGGAATHIDDGTTLYLRFELQRG